MSENLSLRRCHGCPRLWTRWVLALFVTYRLRPVNAQTEGIRPVMLVLRDEMEVSLIPGNASVGAPKDKSLKIDFSMEKSIWGSHSGHLYFTDRREHKVKQIDPQGVVTVVAGSGEAGFGGDGGPALSAALHSPGALWGDRKGQLYFSDNGNRRLRCVDERGVISTTLELVFAVTGMWGDLAGHLFISSGPANQIWKFDLTTMSGLVLLAGTGKRASAGDGGPALSASLAWPNGIWGDAYGAIYFAEMLGHRIRKIDRSGRISTVAGTGRAGFSGDGGPAIHASLHCPCDVWGDGFDRLYVPDMDNNRVRQIDPDGTIRTLAGTGSRGMIGDGGPADSAALFLPKGVWVDRHGSIYISDTFNYRIRRVDEEGVISTFGKSAEASKAALAAKKSENLLRFTVHQSSVGHSSLAVTNANQHSVLAVDLDRQAHVELLAGGSGRGSSGDGGLASHALLNHPQGLCVSPDGSSLYIVDTGDARLRVVDLKAHRIGKFRPGELPSDPLGDEHFRWHRPTSCAVTSTEVLVVDQGLHIVASVNLKTSRVAVVAGHVGESGCDERRLRCPYGISIRPGSSQLFITDPCCPDAFVRQVQLDEVPLTADSLAAGFQGTAEDRLTLYSEDDENIWVTGIDDCDLEYINIKDGLRRSVEVVNTAGEPADLECILDLAAAPAGRSGMYLLGVGEDGQVIVARTDGVSVLREQSNDELFAASSLRSVDSSRDATASATRGYTVDLSARRRDAGGSRDKSAWTHFSRLFLAFLAGAALLCCATSGLLLYCFKIKHKGYGRMGGTIHYESRMGGCSDGKAVDSFPPCEMEAITAENASNHESGELSSMRIGKIGF